VNRLTEDFAIHYVNNPYEMYDGDETAKSRQERIDAIMDELTIDCKKLPDVILDDSQEILEQIWAIATDGQSDVVGRLNDIIRDRAEKYAEWKVNNS